MKKLLLLIIIIQACTSTSTIEQGICECLEDNYRKHEENYLEHLSELEYFLKKNNRIDESFTSKLELHTYLSQSEYPAFYNPKRDNKVSLNGFVTFSYCLKSMELQRGCDDSHWALELRRKLNKLEPKYGLFGDIEEYQRATNALLNEYIPDDGKDDKLKRLFILNELNRLIPDSIGFDILEGRLHKENLKYQVMTISSSEVINIHAGPEETLLLHEQPVALNELCANIIGEFEDKRYINLTNEGGTVYGHYLKVHKELEKCIEKYHNRISLQRYEEEFENLEKHLQQSLEEEVKIRIIESRNDK